MIVISLGQIGCFKNLKITIVNKVFVALVICFKNDDDEKVRNCALLTLKKLGDEVGQTERVIEEIILLIDDPNSDIRCNAASFLGKLQQRNDKVIDRLITALDSNDQKLRRIVAESFESSPLYSSEKKVFNALINSLNHKDSDIKRMAAVFFEKIAARNDKDIESTILYMSQPNSTQTRQSDLQTISQIALANNEKIILNLIKSLNPPDSEFRRAASTSIEKLLENNEKVVNVLISFFNDEDSKLIEIAFKDLQNIIEKNEKNNISSLNLSLKNQHSEVRCIAATILGHIGVNTQKSIEILITFLNHQDETIKTYVAVLLEKLHHTLETVINLLLSVLRSKESDVSTHVAKSLERICMKGHHSPIVSLSIHTNSF